MIEASSSIQDIILVKDEVQLKFQSFKIKLWICLQSFSSLKILED